MFVIPLAIIGVLFFNENAEFFAQADKNLAAGMTWQVIEDGCRAPQKGELYIASVDTTTGKEYVCFKLKD
tara:strand:+ start:6875 stop:7084 length:210 start_codon:yes stop_codon:yes gene_type:complete